MMHPPTGERPEVFIVGGAVAGLAAVDALADYASVTFFERESYDKNESILGKQ